MVENGSDVIFDRCRFFGAGNDGVRTDGGKSRGDAIRGRRYRGSGRGADRWRPPVARPLPTTSWRTPRSTASGAGRGPICRGSSSSASATGRPTTTSTTRPTRPSSSGATSTSSSTTRSTTSADGLPTQERSTPAAAGIGAATASSSTTSTTSTARSPGAGEHGVYLDDCLSGIRVFGNLFVDISGHAMMHGGGRDDFFENNIAVRCGTALHTDARGVEWIKNDDSDWDLRRRLHDDGVEYQAEPWCSTWPALCAIPDDWTAIPAPVRTLAVPRGFGLLGQPGLGQRQLHGRRQLGWGDGPRQVRRNRGQPRRHRPALQKRDRRRLPVEAGLARLRTSRDLSTSRFPQMGIIDGLSLIFEDGFEWGDTSRWAP